MKIETVKQGKTVIELDDDGFLVMHPDGSVEWSATKAKAERVARNWYQTDLGKGCKIGLGEIEWRI